MFCLCFAFDFVDFQITVNELVICKVLFPPAPLSDSLEKNGYILQID